MKNRLLPLAVVVALGLAAPLGSLALFYWWQPVAPSLAGTLPTPPPPVEEAIEADIDPAEWRGKWTLLVVAPTADSCGDACARRLCRARQLRKIVAPRRLRRVLLAAGSAPLPPRLEFKNDCGETRAADLREIAPTVDLFENLEIVRGAVADPRLASAAIVVFDPQARAAIYYDDDSDLYAMRKDLARLLRYARR